MLKMTDLKKKCMTLMLGALAFFAAAGTAGAADGSLCMLNTSYTEDKTIDTTTELTSFGVGSYLLYKVPVKSTSTVSISADITFTTAKGHNGIGFIETDGTSCLSYIIGGYMGVKAQNTTGSILSTGGMGFSSSATTGTCYSMTASISGGYWTISWTSGSSSGTKSNKFSSYYSDTSMVFLAIGGTNTANMIIKNITVSDTDNNASYSITSLKYAALPTLALGATSAAIEPAATSDIAVTAYSSGTTTCDYTAVSSNTSVATVSTDFTARTVTITGVATGSATITVTNSSDTDLTLTKTISVTVVKYGTNNTGLTLNSLSYAYPVNGETAAYDNGYLRLTFDSTPVLASGGFFKIYSYKSNTSTLIDTVNFIDETQTENAASAAVSINVGAQLVRVSGNSIYFTPHNNKLAANTTYYIAIPEGVITTSSGGTPTIGGQSFYGLNTAYDATNGWSFTTGSDPSISVATAITVDNSESSTADFRSLNAALYAVYKAGTSSDTYTINVAAGTYYELVYYKGAANVKIVGQGTATYGADTIIEYVNCNDMNGSTHTRAAFYFGGGANLVLENLTIKNLTERGTKYITSVAATSNSQAEAIYFANGSGYHLAAYNCSFYSHQDTIQTTGKNWFYKCYIEGDVDYIWGTADVCLVEKCSLRCVYDSNASSHKSSILVSRTGSTSSTTVGKGYVIKDCTIAIASGQSVYYGRETSSSGITWYDQAAVIDSAITTK